MTREGRVAHVDAASHRGSATETTIPGGRVRSVGVRTRSVDEAISFSNDYAPEHLILHLEDAPAAVAAVENAGSVFVGAYSPERYVSTSSFCFVISCVDAGSCVTFG